MRAALTEALHGVGVGVGDRLPAETLVRSATAWMAAAAAEMRAFEQRDAGWRAQIRPVLTRAGRDPGAHASLDDLIAEVCAVADGRVVGR